MSELMRCLYDYLSARRVLDFRPQPRETACAALRETREAALLETLTEQQKALWEQWQDADLSYTMLYEEALFLAAFSLARELGSPIPFPPEA